jgi:hypothetical protein
MVISRLLLAHNWTELFHPFALGPHEARLYILQTISRGFVGIRIADSQVFAQGRRFSIIYVLGKTLDLLPDILDSVQTDGETKRGVGRRREVFVNEVDALLRITRRGETFEEPTHDIGWEVGVGVRGVRRGYDR